MQIVELRKNFLEFHMQYQIQNDAMQLTLNDIHSSEFVQSIIVKCRKCIAVNTQLVQLI